ncbi:hypothetical protein [Macellibacteroides fermentans]|uniref:hypothetical protein n=1 Tax=Macellibacteroides fermentans TaxID=879969 RepID=UPI00406CC8E3
MAEGDLTHSDLSFFKELEQYSFDSKMILCQKFASRIMSSSEVDIHLAFNQNIMPWELETFAAFSVIYDIENVELDIDMDVFSRIITMIRNYWHPELTIAEANGSYADTFMMISALQQFPVQGVFLQKLFRYNYIFNFSNSNINMKEEFCGKFLAPYIDFAVFAFIVFVYCSKDANIKGQEAGRQRMLEKAFRIDNVFKALCIEKETYKKKLEELYKNNVLDYYYGLKIQYVHPLISGLGFTYIPSPYLVINAVTESLLNRLTFGNKKLRIAFGKEVIENYLFDIYKEVPGVTWISQEFSYNVGREEKLTADVLVAEGNCCTFYDTKALSPSLKVRQFDQEEINKEIEIYAKNILQVYQQIIYYSEGRFNLDKAYETKNIFGIVVVLEDAVVPREKVYAKAFEMWAEKLGSITVCEREYT